MLSFQIVLTTRYPDTYRCLSLHVQRWARYVRRERAVTETWVDISAGWLRISYHRELWG